MRSRSWRSGLMVVVVCSLMTACGQKGPPLAPLHVVPAAVAEPVVRRVGDRVRLRFRLPNRNDNGPGRLELDRVEIYAMTVSPDDVPSPREIMSSEHLIGQIAVRPVLEEGEQPAPGEQRPEPGSAVTFDEELTASKVKPQPVKEPVKPVVPAAVGAAAGSAAPSSGTAAASASTAATAPAGSVPAAPAATPPATTATPGPTAPTAAPPGTSPSVTAPAATPATPPAATPAAQPGAAGAAPTAGVPSAAATPPAPTHVRRIYIARGVTRRGRPGAASSPMAVPLVDLPAPPSDVKPRVTERGVTLEWTATTAAATYNVYRGEDVLQPINTAVLTTPTFEHAVGFGEEQCYRVRSVAVVDGVSLEGQPSAPLCVTPRDQFPPAAPRGLAAVPTQGQVSLIWDANTEKDLAGYLVLRGDAPDGPLKAITPSPIRETSYRDTTIKPGSRYIYAIVAVDSATPPNMSPQSARVEETAR